MKSIFALTSFLFVTTAFAQVTFSDTADLDKAHSDIRLADVQYRLLPSKTQTRRIPGCRPTGNASRDCTETVVLERQPVVQVSVAYEDGIFHDSDRHLRKQYLTLNLHPELFSEESLAELSVLRKASRLVWAAKSIELQTALVIRNVQVIDLRNSNFCPIDNEPYPRPGCVEVINYKPGQVKVHEVKIVVK